MTQHEHEETPSTATNTWLKGEFDILGNMLIYFIAEIWIVEKHHFDLWKVDMNIPVAG